MKKYLPLLLVVTSLTVAEEVSVYGDSSASYNLTSTEKHILKTQTSVSNLSSKLDEINSLVNSINSRLNGLESTYEGDSARLNSKLNELQKNGVSSDLGSNNDSTANQSDLNALKAALTKLTALVNKINSEYVSSTELEKNMQQFVTREEFEAVKKAMGVKTSSVSPTKTTETKSASIDDSSSSTATIGEVKTAEDKAKLMNEAKKDYDAKAYNTAIPKYEKLIEVNYKPAENNFYLGEMWYKRKKYDTAISHFKKSAMLNDKAAYMPTLLLHSAISFENVKDKENAKSFYGTLIELYPNSSEAKEAKTKLSKL
ncbi:tetratricopeptide repeat protein [Aliarcobacter butzleri]|uniref:tetratricopeptide repeat protein n=1 Tax=Aliarcobacter butzleri TaxID=28197 RepID=UPI001162894A|nr:tetratricopeptide repeat protein [Aliarcobacter butzleri]MCP3649778.1 tetratricopeptide repeat protein [Arcobacter sp. DNRA7]MCR1815952.1 tetratricopeptide repeat protein [Aliarcobacter butzleri]MCT7568015.1 tetratricopeptide repeat protein [Aliarcobacter butzleri]QDM01617.1 tetratricopeptide repeat protein [Aliarcobacter butzleri]